ncbi:uncharacterized protein LOC113274662 isoform X2 [Papaver somniferum]|uniref:uncharacterized protein LOC113274662 isoform X2 n=1 Tax=Papaver somniferum TaxID=3469 RepID=UPI000E6F7123|nr:uncharacterized protein LOC113274662 isoform X2 [Papaver somniferum]
MPITRSQERGVSPHVWQSSDAGIPLKKRKFMFVRQPSPEPELGSSPRLESREEEQCIGNTSDSSCPTEFSGFHGCSSTEKSIPGKEEEGSAGGNVSLALNASGPTEVNRFHGCSSNEESILRKGEEGSAGRNVSLALNASGATEVNGFHGCSSIEESISGKGEQGSAGANVRLALTASGATKFSGFHGSSSNEESIPGNREEGPAGGNVSLALTASGPTEFSGFHGSSNNVLTVSAGFGSELSLQLAPSINPVPETGKEEVIRKIDCSMGVETDNSTNSIKTELLFVSKVSADMASAGEQTQRVCKDQDKLDPNKWNLGLPNGQKFSNSNDLKLALNSANDANRTHWDLNTTMETWEGSLKGAASVGRNGCTNAVDDVSARDVKPVIGSTQMVISKAEGSNVDLGKKILNKSKQQCGPDDLLRLGVHPSVPQSGLSLGLLSIPKEVDSSRVSSNLRLPERLVPPPKVNGIVKSEPSDEGSRLEPVVKPIPPKIVPLQGRTAETPKPAKIVPNSVNLRTLKSEPGQGVCVENPKIVEKVCMQSAIRPLNSLVPTPSVAVASDTRISHAVQFPIAGLSNLNQQGGRKVELVAKVIPPKIVPSQGCTAETHMPAKIVQTSVNPKGVEKLCMQSEIRPLNSVVHTPVAVAVASDPGTPITGGISPALQLPVAGVSNSNTKEAADHALLPAKKEMLLCGGVEQGATNNVPAAVGSLSRIASPDGKESKSADDTIGLPEKECLDVANPNDMESNLMDGHHSKPLENREASENDEKVDIPAEEECPSGNDCTSGGNHDTNAHDVENNDCENGEVQKTLEHSAIEEGIGQVLEGARNFPDDNRESASDVDMDISESDDCAEKSESILLDRKEEQCHNGVAFFNVPLPVESSIARTQEEFIKYVRQLDQAERELQRGSSVFSKTESHVNNEEIAKDVNAGGNKSRIINLPRASSNVSQSGESGKIPIEGMVFSSRNHGEGSNCAEFEDERFRGRGNREGRYMDPRFERKRNRDHQPFRSSGSEFRHSRGRVDNRVRNVRNEWDPEFSTEHGHGQSNFRFTRSKDNTSSKYEGSDFVPRGGRTVGTGRGRGRRKSLDNELQSYRHPPSRRRSPGGREGPVSRGIRIRRGPRDVSPDRCIPEDDPDLIGLRHEEKFIRVLPGEVMNKDFSRSQPQYERLQESFLHGNQRFLPMQRRIPLHMPRVHSKSPPRSRTRSPGPWLSPRRRSPDEFVGHPDLNNCRSPRLYRIERMRSPQRHPCFAEGMVVRRNGSPPQYITRPCNDSREMGSSRDLDHPRSYMRSRSPGQIVPRSARRFVVDPRERPETDELFAEAIHSGRFHDLLVSNGGEDDRRNGIERPGPVRSFHPPYNDNSDGANFHHHDEDGPPSRPYRFIAEVDGEIHERGNTRGRRFERGSLRGRGFERQIKNQPDKATPRTRSAEEQEESYWQSEQQNWHEMSPF